MAAREGAAGLALVSRQADRLGEVREEVLHVAPNAEVMIIDADLSSEAEIERMVATALGAFHGHLDVLVANQLRQLLRQLQFRSGSDQSSDANVLRHLAASSSLPGLGNSCAAMGQFGILSNDIGHQLAGSSRLRAGPDTGTDYRGALQ